jgi:hypothetical protein
MDDCRNAPDHAREILDFGRRQIETAVRLDRTQSFVKCRNGPTARRSHHASNNAVKEQYSLTQGIQ